MLCTLYFRFSDLAPPAWGQDWFKVCPLLKASATPTTRKQSCATTHLGHEIPLPPFRVSPQRRELQDFLVQELVLGFVSLKVILLGTKNHRFTQVSQLQNRRPCQEPHQVSASVKRPTAGPSRWSVQPPLGRRRSRQDYVLTLRTRHVPALADVAQSKPLCSFLNLRNNTCSVGFRRHPLR